MPTSHDIDKQWYRNLFYIEVLKVCYLKVRTKKLIICFSVTGEWAAVEQAGGRPGNARVTFNPPSNILLKKFTEMTHDIVFTVFFKKTKKLNPLPHYFLKKLPEKHIINFWGAYLTFCVTYSCKGLESTVSEL